MQELLWRNVEIDKAFRCGGEANRGGRKRPPRWSMVLSCLLQTFRRLRLLPRITPLVCPLKSSGKRRTQL